MAMYYLIDNYTDDFIDKIDSITPGGAAIRCYAADAGDGMSTYLHIPLLYTIGLTTSSICRPPATTTTTTTTMFTSKFSRVAGLDASSWNESSTIQSSEAYTIQNDGSSSRVIS